MAKEGSSSSGSGIERLRALHAETMPFCRNLMIFCLVLGVLLIAMGVWQQSFHPVLFLLPGIVSAAVAIFPWLALKERRERVDGLGVLDEEWQDVETNRQERPAARDGLVSLLWKIYDEKSFG